jgi:hypothetical protein
MHETHSLSVSLQKQPLLVFTMCGGGKDTSKLSFTWVGDCQPVDCRQTNRTLTCLIHGMAGGLQQQTAKGSIKHDINLEGSNTKRRWK